MLLRILFEHVSLYSISTLSVSALPVCNLHYVSFYSVSLSLFCFSLLSLYLWSVYLYTVSILSFCTLCIPVYNRTYENTFKSYLLFIYLTITVNNNVNWVFHKQLYFIYKLYQRSYYQAYPFLTETILVYHFNKFH